MAPYTMDSTPYVNFSSTSSFPAFYNSPTQIAPWQYVRNPSYYGISQAFGQDNYPYSSSPMLFADSMRNNAPSLLAYTRFIYRDFHRYLMLKEKLNETTGPSSSTWNRSQSFCVPSPHTSAFSQECKIEAFVASRKTCETNVSKKGVKRKRMISSEITKTTKNCEKSEEKTPSRIFMDSSTLSQISDLNVQELQELQKLAARSKRESCSLNEENHLETIRPLPYENSSREIDNQYSHSAPIQHLSIPGKFLVSQETLRVDRSTALNKEKGNINILNRDTAIYKCEQCQKVFHSKCNFNRHKRVHTGERPYACDTCGAQFSQVANLNYHLRIHNEERPYDCHSCGKSFRSTSHLKRHSRIHTGEKPYNCTACNLSFPSWEQRKRHAMTCRV